MPREAGKVPLHHLLTHAKPRSNCNSKGPHLREEGLVESSHCTLALRRGTRGESHSVCADLGSARFRKCLVRRLIVNLKNYWALPGS